MMSVKNEILDLKTYKVEFIFHKHINDALYDRVPKLFQNATRKEHFSNV